MKKIYSILLCVGLIAGFVSCEQDRDFTLTTLSISGETITPSYEIATVSCAVKANATINDVFVHYSVNSNFMDYSVTKMTKEKGVYTAQLVDLLDNTMYYVRYEAVNKYSSAITDDIAQFQTLELSLPVIDIDTISNVYDSHAQAHIRLSFDGGTPVTEMGVCWNTQANPTIDNDKATTEDAVAIVDITALQPNTTYYARAYAKNKLGVSYSREMVVTTYALPEVRTEEVADIQLRSAQLVGTLLFTGNDDATTKGFCWSDKPEPTIEGNHIQIDVESESYTYLLDNLVPETQYYVRAYAQNMIGTVYGEEVSFTTNEQSSTPNNGTENGYEYVDLGLSVKWATCNVGASKPEDYGDHFAWGETEPKTSYSESNYSYTDNPTTLPLSADAARVNWGGNWRMPTDAEMTELREQCTWIWTTQNGVNGYKVTGTNGNSIFLPAAGYRDYSSLSLAGIDGAYRSSSLSTNYTSSAYCLLFNSSYVGWGNSSRYYGHSVRPVCP